MPSLTATNLTLSEEVSATGSYHIDGLLAACQDAGTLNYTTPSAASDSLHLNLRKDQDGTVVHLYLLQDKETSTLHDAEITLRAWDGSIIASRFWTSKAINPKGRGWASFCTVTQLRDKLATNDSCTIQYTVTRYNYEHSLHPSGGFRAVRKLPRLLKALFDDVGSSDVRFVIAQPHAAVQAIHAHSKILMEASEYFNTMFGSGFAEGHGTDPVSMLAPRPSTLRVDAERSSDMLGPVTQTSEHVKPVAEIEEPDPRSSTSLRATANEATQEPIRCRQKRTVTITDTPYETYRAVLHFLYTQSIAFSPLESTYVTSLHRAIESDANATFVSRDIFNKEHAAAYWTFAELGTTEICDIPQGDPKLLYELADRMDIPDLKKGAASYIESSITPANVVTELFSEFTARHDEFQPMQFERVIANWDDVSTTPVMKEVLESPNPHTVQMLLRLFGRLRVKEQHTDRKQSET
ncbi:hypothetical protein PUNSTDRAFT_144403 [Punctularia strigosozonata HHB-11173 SS5]|uniref:uncharacterized protein n=1 Tax=Punctularia strigosozonata (strain HHB-11173) TaxID=741275 RepID=UPI0004417AAA|nr:uncharacterized protein PUNSTDRAFT_144403 [Punctularia strigosozonata HHB-11173 SS5]EIN07914.1 hypothetical protein PUNSTDRAFT_144403 [Punctularia strigosozonata HHB-11173 SS5]